MDRMLKRPRKARGMAIAVRKPTATVLVRQAQKEEFHGYLNQKFKKGDTWCLVDVRWMKMWKKFVGYDAWDQGYAGQMAYHPGPVDTSNLFATDTSIASDQSTLKEHLMEELDYSLVPEKGWEKLVEWYGLATGSKPIARKAVEYGLYMKHVKVEVYLLNIKLAMHPNLTEHVIKEFSRVDTVGDLEAELRKVYAIPAEIPCRVWHRYGSHASELLNDSSQTLQEVGLYNMLAIVIEKQNSDGTWSRGSRGLPMQSTSTTTGNKKPQQQQKAASTRKPSDQGTPAPKPLIAGPTKEEALEQNKAGEELAATSHSSTNEEAIHHCREEREQPPNQLIREGEQIPPQVESEDVWLLKQQQSQHDELVHSVAAEHQRANQASQRAQEALDRLARRESHIQSLNKTLEENGLQLLNLERSLTEEQNKREEAETRASKAEQSVAAASQRATRAEESMRQQVQDLTKSLQAAEEEKDEIHKAAQSRIRHLENELRGVQQQRQDIAGQLQDTSQRLHDSQQQLRDSQQQLRDTEQRLHQAYQRADEQQERAATAETRLQHSDQMFQDMFQRLIGQLPQSQPYWVVKRDEIELVDEELGSGGWATVRVGKSRGNRVAAKCLHRQIVSAHNVRLFTREMNMAANARHPNLLQFIGATLDNQEPIIVTELMPTSLRRVLEEGTQLTHPQIVSVSRQVALALNYLHLTQPEAIVHRDVSSSNVLLDPHQSSWKAKLSDYGSANFVRHTTTAGPGNPTYAAPEANNPERHSAKMDVFSFGILLVEMCSGELAPEEHRDRLLVAIQWPAMVALIRQCLKYEPQQRPDMHDVITQLEQLLL